MSNVSRAAGLAAILVLLAAVPAMALTTVTVTQASLTTFDFGDTSSVTALNSSPGASGIDLGEAITASNNTAGTDDIVIEIATGLTIQTLPVTLPVLSRSHVTIQGDLTSTIDGVALQPGLLIENASNIAVVGLNFDNVFSGVQLTNVTDSSVTNCTFGATTIFTGITAIDCTSVSIGGPNPADGNQITKCSIAGIVVDGGTGNSIQYNLIGTNPLNASGLGCGLDIGVTSGAQNTLIAHNTICASSGAGIQVEGATTSGVNIVSNRVGVGLDGVTPVGNSTGIFVESDASGVTIGSGSALDANIIAHNGMGIRVDGASTFDVAISNNRIFNNDDTNGATVDGIRLTNGGNGGIAAPVLSSVSPVVTGTAVPNSVVEIFVDSGDQGETYLESVTADSGTGAFTGTISLDVSPYEGLNITATATLANNTSQFSTPMAVASTPPSVLSIALDDSTPTNAPEVSFTVTFSEPVTGIETGALSTSDDFALVDTVGAALTSISGSGDNYTVTVSTGTGDGTIRLDVLQGGGIQDVASQGLAADFTSGPSYNIVHVKFLQDLPAGDTVEEGADVTLTVGADGPGPLSYQWYHEVVAKAAFPFGPSSPSITLANVNGGDAGDYYVDVTAGSETVTSSVYTLTVNLQTPVPVAGGLGLLVLGGMLAWAGARRKS